MDNLELIEAYFNNELAQERKSEFDRRIISDPAFAEEVAFYLSFEAGCFTTKETNKEKSSNTYMRMIN